MQPFSFVLVGALFLFHASTTGAFLAPQSIPKTPHSATILARDSVALKSMVKSGSRTDVEDMKREIEELKLEAIRRLEALSDKVHVTEDELQAKAKLDQKKQEEEEKKIKAELKKMKEDAAIQAEREEKIADLRRQDEETRRLIQETLREEAPGTPPSMDADVLNLLDNTRWRLNLNIGREPGTWMPKTWGISGERLLMNLEVEFTPNPLSQKDDFLGSNQFSKSLHVVDNQLQVTPNMKEGSIQVKVSDGGWRVARGEGPMGTDILRFYMEIQEETRHQGSDVYCPAGRIYCQCGYFAMLESPSRSTGSSSYNYHSSGLRDAIRQEQEAMNAQYELLSLEMKDDTDLVSWKKFQRAKQMMDIRIQAEKLNKKMHEAQIREPGRASLRMSRDQRVGLTRPGGVCCKVHKGVTLEYHILGKFEAASIDNRDHANYKELLP